MKAGPAGASPLMDLTPPSYLCTVTLCLILFRRLQHVETWMDLINVVTGQGSHIVFVQGSGSFCKATLARMCDLLPLVLLVVVKRKDEE